MEMKTSEGLRQLFSNMKLGEKIIFGITIASVVVVMLIRLLLVLHA